MFPLHTPQGLYAAATLSLCEVLDHLGLADVSSRLETGLGRYWEVSEGDAREAAEQAALQVGTLT